MIKLGGNINLEGFEDLEPAILIVVKKFVGNAAKKLSENFGDFEELLVELKQEGKKVSLKGKLTIGGEATEDEAEGDNLFFVLNSVFNGLTEKLKK